MLPKRNISNYTSIEQEAEMEDEDSKKKERRKVEERGVIHESFPKNSLCVVIPYIKQVVCLLRTVSLLLLGRIQYISLQNS